jgi:hypothetical protein
MGLQQLYLTGEDLESELDEKTKQMVDVNYITKS